MATEQKGFKYQISLVTETLNPALINIFFLMTFTEEINNRKFH